jgi:hypothetical protein
MKMRTPGFTAETSLRGMNEFYSQSGALETSGGGAKVVPQACVSLGPCRVCVTIRKTFGIPTGACLQFSCLGFNKSFCVP